MEAENGLPLWKTELGGEIADDIVVSEANAFSIVKNSTGEITDVSVRAVSLSTGVGVWQTKIEMPTADRLYLLNVERFLVVVTGGGGIYTLEKNSGRIDFSLDSKNPIASPPFALPAERSFLFISQDRIMRFSVADKKITASAKISGGARILSAGADSILTGDESGRVSLYSAFDLKRHWTIRAGVEIGDALEFAEGYMLSSNDNFVYFVSKKSGRRQWKSRLTERTKGARIGTKTGAFSGVSGKEVVFLEAEKGKVVNRIPLPDDNYFTNKPIVVGEFLILPTAKGAYSYSSRGCRTKGAPV